MSFQRRFGAFAVAFLLGSVVGCSTSDVKIGAIISETGAVAPYGQQVKRGMNLALDEINAAGGFKGSAIQLVYRDDASNSEKGVAAIEELIEVEGVKMVVGAISSPVTLSIAPICQEQGVLLLSPSSSAPQITDAGDLVFRNFPSDVLEGTAMADFAKGIGLHRIVIFALDNDFGRGLEDVFTKGFESRSRSIVETFDISIQAFDDPNIEVDPETYAAIVEEAKALEPDGIYIVGYVREMVALLKQLHAAEIDAVLMATASVTDQVTEQVGEAAENLVFPRPSFDVESSDPAVAPFVQAFRARYDVDPDLYSAHGYDAVKLLWQSMLDTGYSHPDEVRRGLLGLKNFNGAAGRTAFDERGDVVRYPRLFVVRGGEPMAYERFEQDGGVLPVPGGS